MNLDATLRRLRSAWYLRARDWRALARRELRPLRPVKLDESAPSQRVWEPAVPYLAPPDHARAVGLERVRLLNHEERFEKELDWHAAGSGPDWAEHWHRFEWCRSPECNPEERLRAIRDWIHRVRDGSAWHPVPLSRRVRVWLKLLTTRDALPSGLTVAAPILASLSDQVATLAAHPEAGVLALDEVPELAAVVGAGLIIDSLQAQRWRARQERLVAALGEEIGPDGMHGSRSPSIHAEVLEALLDLTNVLQAAPAGAAPELEQALRARLPRMLGALSALCHPDGEIALFGDSAFGLAQSPAALLAYAAALGIEVQAPERPGVLPAAGFVRLEAGPFVLLAGASTPSPPARPQHAHCDALSFELSVSGRRVVTDTGTFQLAAGPERESARCTAAHATVEIDGAEQAEIWHANRIGGRPDVAWVELDRASASGVCAGWATPEVLHRRRFELDADAVTVRDDFDRVAPRARLRLPLAPGLEPRIEADRAVLDGPVALVIELPGTLRWRVERTAYFPEMGRREERACLVGEGENVASSLLRIVPSRETV